jgi:hypothetical protein
LNQGRLQQDMTTSHTIMPALTKKEVTRLPYSVAKALQCMSKFNENDCPNDPEGQVEMMEALDDRVGTIRAALRLVADDDDPSWDETNATDNQTALVMIKRHMHVEVRNMTEKELITEPTPNGRFLPRILAKRFKQWNILQLLRRHPDDIDHLPARTLESLRSNGLTITERRALQAHLSTISSKWQLNTAFSSTKTNLEAIRKWLWYCNLRNRLKEELDDYERHLNQHGHPAVEDCNLSEGECPLKADHTIGYYGGDYGFPVLDGYETSTSSPYDWPSSWFKKRTETRHPNVSEEGQKECNDSYQNRERCDSSSSSFSSSASSSSSSSSSSSQATLQPPPRDGFWVSERGMLR